MAKIPTTFAMAPDSQSARMLVYFKEFLRARGMRYADIADLMGVSEKSIKRYMSGRGITLPILERLCATVAISVSELYELAGSDSWAEVPWTSDAQEAILAAEPKLAIILALLTKGWTVARIEHEGLATKTILNSILVRLDHLGMITLYPKDRVKVRARMRIGDMASAPLRRAFALATAEVIESFDLSKDDAVWRLTHARLGPASVSRLAQRLDKFLAEIAELGRQDMDLSGDQVKWYAICGMVAEYDVLGLKLLREEGSKLSD